MRKSEMSLKCIQDKNIVTVGIQLINPHIVLLMG